MRESFVTSRKNSAIKELSWLLLPTLWITFLTILPLLQILIASLARRGEYGGIVYEFGFTNYARLLEPIYLKIFLNSFLLASVTTIACLIIGYPLAFFMAASRPLIKKWLFFLVVVPLLTNFVVKAFATKHFLSLNGPLNNFLIHFRFVPEPLEMTTGPFAVMFGMVTNYLPFMILPIFVALDRFDFSLIESAQDLGASPQKILSKILWPLSFHSVAAGAILVFVPCLGEFLIPDIFGGAKTMLVGNLINDQFLKARDWPFGSALAAVLMVITCVILSQVRRPQESGVIKT